MDRKMSLTPKKRPRELSEEKLKVRVVHRPPKGPAEFGPKPQKPEETLKAGEGPRETFKVSPVAKRVLIKHKETPAKIATRAAPVMSKTVIGAKSVLAIVAVIIGVGFGIFYYVGGLGVHQPNVTGTWISEIPGQGLVSWTASKEGNKLSGSETYYDVEMNLTQAGDTVNGTIKLTVVSVGQLISKEWIGKTFSPPVTGKVMGDYIELKIGDEILKGGWTEDHISCTSKSVQPTYPGGPEILNPVVISVLKVKKV